MFPRRINRIFKTVVVIGSMLLVFFFFRERKFDGLSHTIETNMDKNAKIESYFDKVGNRQRAVLEATEHAWRCYKKHAFGSDEVKPISRRPSHWFRMGLTIIDAADTLALMGFNEEVQEIVKWMNASLNFQSEAVNRFNSLFEMVIRILGGCISAAFITNSHEFRDKATELGDIIVESIEKSGTLVPLSEINVAQKRMRGMSSSLSEIGSIQLELYALSVLTNDMKYAKCAYNISTFLHSKLPSSGLLQMYIDPNEGTFSGDVLSLGARADSFYEYLIKQWLYLGQNFRTLVDDFFKSFAGVQKYLLRKSMPNKLWFIGEIHRQRFVPKMDHLACFYPGTLALAYSNFPHKKDLLSVAQNVMYTCLEIYRRQSTGLSPEITYFNMGNSSPDDFFIKDGDAQNLLRPETTESLFYLYRITRNRTYQDWGWEIFLAFNRSSRYDKCGFTQINDVRNPSPQRIDKMDSYFLSEALKYLYLLFSESQDEFPLDQWIFNTEGHPFLVKSNFFDVLL